MNTKRSSSSSLSIWGNDPPYSTDPIDYDAFIHHIAFRSVLSSVLTQYHLGNYEGILAESWSPSSEHKVWKFKIRKNLRFENGDEITPEHIVKSWMRIAYFQKQRNSESGFLELLEGFKEIKSINSKIDGLKIQGDEIELKFTKPMKKLLETISFGLYSVVHPNDYDQKTGKWKDPKKVISSGGYKIASWDKKS
ncbi:MAG: hypothetical protein HY072_01710 [Deltaproteobacteria bacterium]|nr:hypothetical protein [Deltaproteobacteria bacterium]